MNGSPRGCIPAGKMYRRKPLCARGEKKQQRKENTPCFPHTIRKRRPFLLHCFSLENNYLSMVHLSIRFIFS